ncbi:MAG: hypothetical protein U1A28_03515, partial [Patescibacteria group bacterium]|nr:hypothetical protein [Patescibacteria group bacterium]
STVANVSNLLTLKVPAISGGLSYSGLPFLITDNASTTIFSIDGRGRIAGFVSSASSTIDGPAHVVGLFQASSTVLIGGGRVDYSVRSTSTIPNSQPYAWTVATSTTAEPIWRIDTSYSLAASGRATSSIRGGLTVDSGAFEYDYGSGITSADSFQTGPMSFDTDPGIISWIDLPVATTTPDIINRYSAQIDTNPLLTIYSVSDGKGTTKAEGVAIGSNGTTTSTSRLTVWATSTAPYIFDIVSAASSTVLVVDTSGRLGVGTSTPSQTLSVHGNALIAGTTTVQGLIATSTIYTAFPGPATIVGVCHSGADIDAATVGDVRQLVACSDAPGDIAEFYETKAGVAEGDIVMTTEEMFTYAAAETNAHTGEVTGTATRTIAVLDRASPGAGGIIGIVSTDPYKVFGRAVITSGAKNPQPVSLVGRVPVKVNLENGSIKIGDRVALSETAGVGRKANQGETTVGVALEPFSGGAGETGLINVFVNLAFGSIDEGGRFVAAASATGGTTELSSADIDRALSDSTPSGGIIAEGFQWVLDQFEKIGIVFRNGIVKATALIADKVIARKAVLDALELKDSATGDTYCVRITSGEISKFRGTCGETPGSAALEPFDDGVSAGAEEGEAGSALPTSGAGVEAEESGAESAAPAPEPETEAEPLSDAPSPVPESSEAPATESSIPASEPEPVPTSESELTIERESSPASSESAASTVESSPASQSEDDVSASAAGASADPEVVEEVTAPLATAPDLEATEGAGTGGVETTASVADAAESSTTVTMTP